jgi:hypothetical protein
MESSHQFQLQLAVDNYLQGLQAKGNYTGEDLLELKSHLLDEVADLRKESLDEEEAFLVARKRLGNEHVLGEEFKKVNGERFFNRDMFMVAIGICTFLFFFYFYQLIKREIVDIAIYQSNNPGVWGVVGCLVDMLMAGGLVYCVINLKKCIHFFEKRFTHSPVNFAAVFILLLVTVYLLSQFGTNLFSQSGVLSAEQIRNKYTAFEVSGVWHSLITWLIPCVWMVVILYAFTKSYKQVNFLHYIINKSGYIGLFLLGVFWDALAASARLLDALGDGSTPYSVYAFGLVWFVGMLLFNLRIEKKVFGRNLAFMLFGFVVELGAGIWINPALRNGLPFSAYFIALIVGGAAGLVTAQVFKKRKLPHQA